MPAGVHKPKKPVAPQYSSGLAPQQVILKILNHLRIVFILFNSGAAAAQRWPDESAAKGEENEGRRVRRFHERDAGPALGVSTQFPLFALNIKSASLKYQCPILIADMVRGRRRGRIVDAKDEGSPGPSKKSLGAASNSSEDPLVAMDPGPGDALISLTASVDRRPASRISKRALASRWGQRF